MAIPTTPARLQWAQIVIPVLGSLFGALVGGYLTYQQATMVAQNDYRQKFAATINTMLDSLGNEKKAPIALAALYSLAQNMDEKRIVVTIASTINQPNVQNVLNVFVSADPDTRKLANEERAVVLASFSQSTQTAALAGTGFSSNAVQATRAATAAMAVPAATPNLAGVSLVSSIAKPTSGWIYYGLHSASGTTRLDSRECVNPTAPLPATGSKLSLCGSRYVRDEPSATTGNVIGAAQVGTTVVVNSVKPYPLNDKAEAIWLNVNLPASST